ncbi:DUF6626 family protein [Sulfitobacter mediterraneus]|uniref:Uncharacterized protein n=2 Tax=Sulfitobacter mediterraneus TaxID=83219 RepID=A0A2T6CDE9_9RHOB|nr:hypothetical protein C8N31_107239 [Sulfitobacter mediterraneus]
MTLLESTYRQLHNAGLVHCAEAFSSTYLNKSKNWYAYQKHTRRDYSIDAAVQCLRSIRDQQQTLELTQAQRHALSTAELDLLAHLNAQHCVADVC